MYKIRRFDKFMRKASKEEVVEFFSNPNLTRYFTCTYANNDIKSVDEIISRFKNNFILFQDSSFYTYFWVNDPSIMLYIKCFITKEIKYPDGHRSIIQRVDKSFCIDSYVFDKNTPSWIADINFKTIKIEF